jgi:hypothetical protein
VTVHGDVAVEDVVGLASAELARPIPAAGGFL